MEESFENPYVFDFVIWLTLLFVMHFGEEIG
jgi:hypothetical protein